MPAATVELARGVYRIPTKGDYINSFAFLEEDGSVTLVDCGLKGAPPRILAALASIGRRPEDVQRILLTHAHLDHAGGAAQLIRDTSADGVHAHPDDHRFLAAGEGPPSGGGRLLRIPPGAFEPVVVSGSLVEGQRLDVGGGVRILHTPGHTDGHISLLHEPSGVLITGDCVMHPFRRVIWPFASVCVSPEQNRLSAQRLADEEYSIAAFTHGTEIRSGAREAIRSLLSR